METIENVVMLSEGFYWSRGMNSSFPEWQIVKIRHIGGQWSFSSDVNEVDQLCVWYNCESWIKHGVEFSGPIPEP